MKTLNHKGVEVDAWIEIQQGVGSELTEPTEADITKFKLRGCQHDKQLEHLIYDEPGYLGDLRYCVVCGLSLGVI